MRIELPSFCLVALIGPSGSGKSTFAARHFLPGEVLSSDAFRKMVSNDSANQNASADAFDCLYYVAQKRLDARLLTVVDATSLTRDSRTKLISLARQKDCFAIGIALDMPEKLCLEHNIQRPERHVPEKVVRGQCADMRLCVKHLGREGFRQIYTINSLEELNSTQITRIPLWNNLSDQKGPFDIIGDVHGCYGELCLLLEKLGYQVWRESFQCHAPGNRKAIFTGDICDRGPANVPALKLVMNMVREGHGLWVPGNHDMKLMRYLEGRKATTNHGLDATLAELAGEKREFIESLKDFLRKGISHYILDEGRLVVAHAGLPERLQGRASGRVRAFCLYGDVNGETDEFGLPVRRDWTKEYRGKALVAYGHTPKGETYFSNNTICLDAGCVFGGKLAALRYPEREIVTVDAFKQYAAPVYPLAKDKKEEALDIKDFLGRKKILTTLGPTVTTSNSGSQGALEIMGRYGMDPRWLIYLPPTMSPCKTSPLPDYLEHPAEALAYYRKMGVTRIICEEKHMGSRAVAIVCKNLEAAKRINKDAREKGVIYTRSGRPFFQGRQKNLSVQLLDRLAAALDKSGFWDNYKTDWVCLDCEILPWSLKSSGLIKSQYVPFGKAGVMGMEDSLSALEKFAREKKLLPFSNDKAFHMLRNNLLKKLENMKKYNQVWQAYWWDVGSVDDIGLSPFHILATVGKVWHDVSHPAQLAVIGQYLGKTKNYVRTRNIVLNLDAPDSGDMALEFWKDLTESGAEGMVVKPVQFVAYSGENLVQPAIKCRGREYLRMIYAPDYLDNLADFKSRNLAAKRKRALLEYALGLEALDRFVKQEPLYKIHECVYAILVLECEPDDARL